MTGNCFFFDTPPNGAHLFVVVAPSDANPGRYICVNITAKDEASDTTCELAQSEHSALTKPTSIVAYAWQESCLSG
jgi:hypothetical protein